MILVTDAPIRLHHETLDMLPREAGALARRDGLVRWSPYSAPAQARAWLEGYDAEQAKIDEAAAWARSHAAEPCPWGFA